MDESTSSDQADAPRGVPDSGETPIIDLSDTPPADLARSMRRRRRTWIASAVAAATVASGVVTVVAYVYPRQYAPEFAAPLFPQTGSIRIDASSAASYYPPNGILPESRPPSYPESEQRGHCDEWSQWAADVKAAPIVDTLDIVTNANNTSPITILDFEISVFDKAPLRGVDRIRCQYGAGGYIASALLVDLERPARRTPMDTDGDGSADTTLPGGFFAVDPLRAEPLGVNFTGASNHVYEFGIELTVSENGEQRTANFGSQDQPIRVVLTDYQETGQYYDFDFAASRWVRSD